MEPRSASRRPPTYRGRVGQAIARRCRALGWTAREVEQHCGVDRNAAHRAVLGHHLSARNLDAVLDGLGLIITATLED